MVTTLYLAWTLFSLIIRLALSCLFLAAGIMLATWPWSWTWKWITP